MGQTELVELVELYQGSSYKREEEEEENKRENEASDSQTPAMEGIKTRIMIAVGRLTPPTGRPNTYLGRPHMTTICSSTPSGAQPGATVRPCVGILVYLFGWLIISFMIPACACVTDLRHGAAFSTHPGGEGRSR
eukprot:GHVU01192736.1.p3 GENE.GHVU01192736.1~~GHVU01192736.1.p3  ORF type:complete len:135 (+),score=14.88 GHVU01192736.1:404-808(+)